MARRAELVGIVSPEIDEQALDQEAKQVEEAMGNAAEGLVSGIDTRQIQRKVERAIPGGGLAGQAAERLRGRSSGGVGGAATSAAGGSGIQAAQLEKLDDIHDELEMIGASGGLGGGGGSNFIRDLFALRGAQSAKSGGGNLVKKAIAAIVGSPSGLVGAAGLAAAIGTQLPDPSGRRENAFEGGTFTFGIQPDNLDPFTDGGIDFTGLFDSSETPGIGPFESTVVEDAASANNLSGVLSEVGNSFQRDGSVAEPDWLEKMDRILNQSPDEPDWLSRVETTLNPGPTDTSTGTPDANINPGANGSLQAGTDPTLSGEGDSGSTTANTRFGQELGAGQRTAGGSGSTNRAAERRDQQQRGVDVTVENDVRPELQLDSLRDLQDFLADPERFITDALGLDTGVVR